MKRFEQLTDDELLAIVDEPEQLKILIDLECAHRGIQLLPAPPTPPVAPEAKADLTLYGVKFGYSAPDFFFPDPEVAARLLQFLNSLKGPFWTQNYERSGITTGRVAEDAHFEVTDVKVYSRELWESIKAARIRYEELKKEYDTAEAEYKKLSEQREVVIDEINERVTEVLNWRRNVEALLSKFERYLRLADNQIPIAWGFLTDAEGLGRVNRYLYAPVGHSNTETDKASWIGPYAKARSDG